MSHDGPVNAGSVDPVMAQTVELEALDGTPGSSTFGHCLEQRLLPLSLVVGLVSVPQDDVPSLAVVDQIHSNLNNSPAHLAACRCQVRVGGVPGYGRHSPAGKQLLGHTQSPHVLDHRPGNRNGDLSLVKILRDSVLSLAEIMM